jgi:hypothetical protein
MIQPVGEVVKAVAPDQREATQKDLAAATIDRGRANGLLAMNVPITAQANLLKKWPQRLKDDPKGDQEFTGFYRVLTKICPPETVNGWKMPREAILVQLAPRHSDPRVDMMHSKDHQWTLGVHSRDLFRTGGPPSWIGAVPEFMPEPYQERVIKAMARHMPPVVAYQTPPALPMEEQNVVKGALVRMRSAIGLGEPVNPNISADSRNTLASVYLRRDQITDGTLDELVAQVVKSMQTPNGIGAFVTDVNVTYEPVLSHIRITRFDFKCDSKSMDTVVRSMRGRA